MQSNIIRPRQLGLLNQAATYPFTLLIAAAGSGKSTLLKQWQETHSRNSVIKIEISPRLSEGQALLKTILSEIRKIAPIWNDSIFNLFNSEKPIETNILLESLILAFESIDENLTLILDDFHIIKSKASQNLFFTLIKEIPKNIQFIISSRQYPNFSISRMKLNEQVFIINSHDLKLEINEIKTLNQHLGDKPLDSHQLDGLMNQTQGWFVGVKFALLAFQESGSVALTTFNGTQPEMLNYFGYEVLINLPNKIQEFVLTTALFETFNADICKVVLNVENASCILRKLSAQELFLLPDPTKMGYFKYHPLLHDFLQERLKLTISQQQIQKIHKKSAGYFLKEKKYQLAINHAKYSHDQDYLFSVLRIACDRWLRAGEFDLIIEAIEHVDESRINCDYDLLVSITYALLFSRRFNQANYYLELLKQQNNDSPKPLKYGQGQTLTQAAFIEHMLLIFQREDSALSDSNVTRLANQHSNPDIRALSIMFVAYERIYRGQFHEAFTLAHQARSLVRETGHIFLESYADLLIILSDRYLCRGTDAIKNMITAYEAAPQGGNSPVWVNLATGMMVVHYEQNDLKLALFFCEKLLPVVNYTCATEVITHVYLLLSRLWHMKGEKTKAAKLLTQLERILLLGNYGRFQSQVIQERMRQAIKDKNVPLADSIYHDNKLHLFLKTDVFIKPNQYEETRERHALTSVYWLVTERQFDAAKNILEQLINTLDSLGNKYRALIARCNLLVVIDKSGAKDCAIKKLVQLVEHCGLHSLSRSVFDESPGFKQLFIESVQSNKLKLSREFRKVFNHNLVISPTHENMVKPQIVLTNKELDIFKLLGGGLSNAEISNKACIAVSTTKWHLKNIYSKLDIDNRSAAVIMANQW